MEYTLLESRQPMPVYDEVLKGNLPAKFNHLSKEDKENILALCRIVYQEALTQKSDISPS